MKRQFGATHRTVFAATILYLISRHSLLPIHPSNCSKQFDFIFVTSDDADGRDRFADKSKSVIFSNLMEPGRAYITNHFNSHRDHDNGHSCTQSIAD